MLLNNPQCTGQSNSAKNRLLSAKVNSAEVQKPVLALSALNSWLAGWFSELLKIHMQVCPKSWEGRDTPGRGLLMKVRKRQGDKIVFKTFFVITEEYC